MTSRRGRVKRDVRVRRLGLVSYDDALALQRRLSLGRREGKEPDTLLLLEHPPTITLGRSADPGHVLCSERDLAARGFTLQRCDRGGEVTYHGPGQLVAYPILDLRPDRCGVRRYVTDLEETIIRCCGDFGLSCGRKEGMVGVWLGGQLGEASRAKGDETESGHGSRGAPWRKIGAVGVHVSSWITTHGLSLNVCPEMSHYALINPCGITEHPVTSMARELGGKGEAPPSIEDVAGRLARRFVEIFDATMVEEE